MSAQTLPHKRAACYSQVSEAVCVFRSRYILVLLLALVMLSSCSESRTGISESELRSLLAIDLINVDPEVKEFLITKQENLQNNPNVGSVGELAMAYEMNGFLDTALVAYRIAAELDPLDPKWPYYESLVLASMGDYYAAIECIESSIDLDAHPYLASYLWLGRWHLELNQLGSAKSSFYEGLRHEEEEKHFKELLGLLPEREGILVASLIGIATVHVRRGEFEDALRVMEGLESKTNDRQYLLLVNRARQGLGLPLLDVLEQQSEVSVPIRWHDPRSWVKQEFAASISAVYTRVRKMIDDPKLHAEATRLIDSLYGRYPNSDRVTALQLSSYMANERDQELSNLARLAYSQWPDNPFFQVVLAKVAIAEDQDEEAEAVLLRMLRSDPDDLFANFELGIIYLNRHDFVTAKPYFVRALHLDLNVETAIYMGFIEQALSNFRLAKCYYTLSVQIDPTYGPNVTTLERTQDWDVEEVLPVKDPPSGDPCRPMPEVGS